MTGSVASMVTRVCALWALVLVSGAARPGEAQTFDDPGFAAQIVTTLPP